MDWKHITSGLLDELSKIAEFNLTGISPETALEKSQPPPPFETPALTKALAVLDRVQTVKTAARLRGTAIGAPQYAALGKAPQGPPPTALDEGKRLGVNVIGGMGIGKVLTDTAQHIKNVRSGAGALVNGVPGYIPKASPKMALTGVGLGGAVGLANYMRTRHREKKFAKISSFTSPAEQLKATRQVGAMKQDIHQGPSIKAQIPLVGRKMVPGGTP